MKSLSAADRAYGFVKDKILGWPIETGFVSEDEVARDLGVSRTPVREALRRLEAEGLISRVPNRGAFIQPISDREVLEVMEVRAVIECYCAERVLADPERLETLCRSLSAILEEQGRVEDPADFIECDRRLHREVAAASGNQVMVDLYEKLRDQQMRMGIRALMAEPQRRHSVLAEHGVIVEAFRAGRLEEVQRSIREHLRETATILRTNQVRI